VIVSVTALCADQHVTPALKPLRVPRELISLMRAAGRCVSYR
jgi:hypothetical protein